MPRMETLASHSHGLTRHIYQALAPLMWVTRPVSSSDVSPRRLDPGNTGHWHRHQVHGLRKNSPNLWQLLGLWFEIVRESMPIRKQDSVSQIQYIELGKYGDHDDMVADIRPLFTSRQETRNHILNYKPLGPGVWPSPGGETSLLRIWHLSGLGIGNKQSENFSPFRIHCYSNSDESR